MLQKRENIRASVGYTHSDFAYPVDCQSGDSRLSCRHVPLWIIEGAACARYLERLRWLPGLACAKYGNIGNFCRFAKRRSVGLRCRVCQTNELFMAGTVMKDCHTPLAVWFWGCVSCGDRRCSASLLSSFNSC